MNFFGKKNKRGKSENENSFNNPSVLEVNLIKDEMAVDFEFNKRIFSLFLALFVSALFVTEIYIGLDWWQKEEENRAINLQNDYEKVSKEVRNTKVKSEEVMVFKDKLVVTQKMIDNHIYWTNFFSWLEKNTLNSVSYGGGFSGNISGTYSLAATAKTYSDISWQTRHFQKDKYVIAASVSSGSVAGGDEKDKSSKEPENKENLEDPGVSFALDLKVKPEIFFR